MKYFVNSCLFILLFKQEYNREYNSDYKDYNNGDYSDYNKRLKA